MYSYKCTVMKVNLLELKNIISKSICEALKESVSKVVYHYTHPSSLLNILATNRFEMSDDGGMSLTRQRNDRMGYATAFRNEYFDGAYVRLQLDGDKLNARFSGKPVDEFGARGKMTMGSFHNGTASDRRPFYAQAEDKVFSRNGESIENAAYYIDRIDIQFLVDDERYGFVTDEMEEFIKKLVSLSEGTVWEDKIFIYFDEDGNRNDFNFQTDNCMRIRDLKTNLNESAEETDVLYRGVNNEQEQNCPVVWYTTSREYASLYGKVTKVRLSVPRVLDKLASPEAAEKYLIEDTDEYPFYFPEYFDIQKMKADGYTGYYYPETEYNCLNVCLFK